MRIGIFGGAFNPPHIGHLNAAATALESLQLERLLIIPTGTSPHKELPEGSPSAEERLHMVELAFQEMEHVSVLDVEINRTGPSYTADTLETLHEWYPDAEFWLIIGADMFLSIQSWYQPEEIFALCKVCALSRKDGETDALHAHADFLMERYGAECYILENDVIDISSTELRSALRVDQAQQYLPDRVLQYIKTKGLYHAGSTVSFNL